MELNVTIENASGYIVNNTISDVAEKSTTVVQPELSKMITVAFGNSTDSIENTTHLLQTSGDETLRIDYEELLRKENIYEAKALTPVTIYLIILMIIGVLGNTIVLYVYKFRFKRSTSRIFILSLAVFDLITCLLGMPYHILDMLYPYAFVWDTVCKVLSFALTFTILASIFILDMIAIDRYRKICKPFEKQLSGVGSKTLSWVTVLVAVISAAPMIFIYGSADVPTRIPNVTGKECYISDDYIDSDFPLIYDGFTFMIFIVSVGILVGFYSKVGITVWKRRKFGDSSHELNRSGSGQSTPSTSVIQLNAVTDDAKHGNAVIAHFSKDKKDGVVHVFDSNSSVTGPKDSPSPYKPTTSSLKKDRVVYKKKLRRLMSELSSGEHESSVSERGSTRSHTPRRHHVTKKEKRTLRITVMLFVITVIFIVSFLPYLTIQILNGLDEEFWDNMTIAEIVVFNFLMRTYFINNMINPIIYWFLDHKFKEEVVRLFNDVRKCGGSTTTRRNQRDFHS